MKQDKSIDKETPPASAQAEERKEGSVLSETWPKDAQDELEDFIEQQGIYIRQ